MIKNIYMSYKEYGELLPEYKRICNNICGIGTIVGLFFYWKGWMTLLKWYFGERWERVGVPQEHPLTDASIMFVGLPLSLWSGIIFAGFAYSVIKVISYNDAVSLTIKIKYPRHWLR